MKANRKFIEADDHAVSAVIGVILMVAITVAIAATVYYYVTTMMPKGTTTAPTFQLRVDETNDRMVVVTSASGADWNRLAIKADAGSLTGLGTDVTAYFHLNEEIATALASGSWDTEDISAGPTHAPVAGEGWPLPKDVLVEITDAQDLMSATEYIDFEGNIPAGASAGPAAIPTAITFTIIDTTSNQEIGTYIFSNIQKVA